MVKAYDGLDTKEFLYYNQTNLKLLIEIQVLLMHRNHLQHINWSDMENVYVLICQTATAVIFGQNGIAILFKNIKVHGQNSNYCNVHAKCVIILLCGQKLCTWTLDIMLEMFKNPKFACKLTIRMLKLLLKIENIQ